MTNVDILFWVSIGLMVLSFLLLGHLIIATTRRSSPTTPTSGIGGAQPQALDVATLVKDMGELAASFSKAGPVGTIATLCVFFTLVALAASGVVKIGV